jgi:hypothetical protein
MAAVGLDAIGPEGMPLNGFGAFLKDGLLTHSYDLLGGVSFYLAVFSLVVVPQAASFICCGIFGCASSPRFVSTAYNIVVWGAAKTFAVAGGVLLSFTTYVHWAHPNWIIFSNVNPTADKVLVSFVLGAAAFCGSLMCLWIGFGCQFLVETISFSPAGSILQNISKVARRYQRRNDNEVSGRTWTNLDVTD